MYHPHAILLASVVASAWGCACLKEAKLKDPRKTPNVLRLLAKERLPVI